MRRRPDAAKRAISGPIFSRRRRTSAASSASNPTYCGGLDVMNGGSAVMNDTFPIVHASAILTDASDAPIVPAVPRRTFIPAPLIFVIATAFGVSSTFQAYWMDTLSHNHTAPDPITR